MVQTKFIFKFALKQLHFPVNLLRHPHSYFFYQQAASYWCERAEEDSRTEPHVSLSLPASRAESEASISQAEQTWRPGGKRIESQKGCLCGGSSGVLTRSVWSFEEEQQV